MEENNVVEIKKESKGEKFVRKVKENWWKVALGVLGAAGAVAGGLLVLGTMNSEDSGDGESDESCGDSSESICDVAVGEE